MKNKTKQKPFFIWIPNVFSPAFNDMHVRNTPVGLNFLRWVVKTTNLILSLSVP